ncbi:MAG: hypothetical protein Q4B03_02875 [Lachnospiraceae bacterium]|nr:hypothetical protein [Lachnospiraceae bacterium]
MKEVIAAALAVSGAVILRRKKKISIEGMLLVLFLAGGGIGYCMFAGFSGEWIPVSAVDKGEKGSSSSEMEFQVRVGETDSQVTLEIPAVRMETEEADAEIAALMLRLDTEILGENTSLNEICYPLLLKEQYPDSPVQVQWQTDAPDDLSWEGTLGAEIPDEGADVLLIGDLRLQNSSETYQRMVRVYPSKAPEDLPDRIRQAAVRLNQEETEPVYLLPDSLDAVSLAWYRMSDAKGWYVLCIALFLLAGLVLVQQEKQREAQKNRYNLLDREYPELVSRMQMLLGAGLSMRMVLERLAREYRENLRMAEKTEKRRLLQKRSGDKNPVYEELLISCRELENGMSEAEVYRRFGERCGTPSYRGLSLMLEQNMTKGGQGLIRLLEQETLEAFEARQRKARQEGEKVSVRLLLPMGMMLVIALALIMLPAFMTL